jgi:hypothetical protein
MGRSPHALSRNVNIAGTKRVIGGATVLAVVLLAGCGSAASHINVGAGPPTTATATPPAPTTTVVSATTTAPPTTSTSVSTSPSTSPPSTSPPSTSPPSTSPPSTGTVADGCHGAQLGADQTPISEGTGQYYLAWSLTNTSTAPCALAPGRPSIQLDDAAGQSIVDYTTTTIAGGASSALVVAPGHAVWFLTEELSTACPTPATVAGGPFQYTVTLAGTTVTWSPSYLSSVTLSGLCTRVPIAIRALQATKPRP